MPDPVESTSPAVDRLRAASRVLRMPVSIGLLAGPMAAAVYLVSGLIFEMATGRPSPTQWAGTFIIGLPMLAIGLGALGAVLGVIVLLLRRLAGVTGPLGWGAVTIVAVVVSGLAVAAGVQRGVQIQSSRVPRVLESSEEIVRHPGPIPPGPMTAAAMLVDRSPVSPLASPRALIWQGERVEVSRGPGALVIRRGERDVDTIDLPHSGAVDDVRGVVATLDNRGEWLAVLVDLRSPPRRSLLLIYDPSAALVHKELLERSSARARVLPLAATGKPGQPQAIVVDVGRPVRFSARTPPLR